MSFGRREFLRAGSLLAAGTLVWPGGIGAKAPARDPGPSDWSIRDPAIKAMALAAVEAARAGGARYADARISRVRRRVLSMGTGSGSGPSGTRFTDHTLTEHEALGLGIRALVEGTWGFVGRVEFSVDEAARAGRVAAAQARANAAGRPGVLELAPASAVADGHWTMPAEVDPIEVSREEILDVLASPAYFSLLPWRESNAQLTLSRREVAFASSEGSYLTQVSFATGAQLRPWLRPDRSRPVDRGGRIGNRGWASSTAYPLAGRGWEYIARAPLEADIERMLAEADEDDRLPLKPLEVGRYDVAFDAMTATGLLDGTLGAATELDRALGWEANGGGTSYLDDPLAMLGRYQAAAPTVTVTANRSRPGGVATVRWDEEGVAPEDFTLVKDGVLVDFQTTRETAPLLARTGRGEIRSRGCAGAVSALGSPQLQRPNLRLEPGRGGGFEELVAGMERGIAVKQAVVDMDYNALNGMVVHDSSGIRTMFFEVRRGRRVARLQPNAALVVRAPELWRQVAGLGSADSVKPAAGMSRKGDPPQLSYRTVEAPPFVVRQVALIDRTR